MSSSTSTDKVTVVTHPEQLVEIFREAESPRERWLIGAESEKFGVHAVTGAPLQYEGEHGVLRVLEALASHGWDGVRESADGPVIALTRGLASVTLEPGAQLELSGTPLPDIHGVARELDEHQAELREISADMGLAWLATGFHPLAKQADLPWVPKRRYALMRSYLPPLGDGALDMMRRTATVQANFDYSSEEDALRKLRISTKATPIAVAMMANAPFAEGCVQPFKTLRGDVWLRMDKSRSGLIPALWERRRHGYATYIEWALDAGMFLFKRDGQYVANTGQTFRAFMRDGFEGHRATLEDFRLHLNTLFPEVRLKRTIEVRCCDSLPGELAPAMPALFTGLIYDDTALARAEELLDGLTVEDVEAARPHIVRDGLTATLQSKPLRGWAESLVEIALDGLARRARLNEDGDDERVHLRPLARLVELGQTPADVVLRDLDVKCPKLPSNIVKRTRI